MTLQDGSLCFPTPVRASLLCDDRGRSFVLPEATEGHQWVTTSFICATLAVTCP
jgi:hypothetical protein